MVDVLLGDASFKTSSSSFEIDIAGIEEICKSEGMQSALREQADKICANANSAANSHADVLYAKRFFEPAYKSYVDTLTHTAVGAVVVNSEAGQIVENRFKCLSNQNH